MKIGTLWRRGTNLRDELGRRYQPEMFQSQLKSMPLKLSNRFIYSNRMRVL